MLITQRFIISLIQILFDLDAGHSNAQLKMIRYAIISIKASQIFVFYYFVTFCFIKRYLAFNEIADEHHAQFYDSFFISKDEEGWQSAQSYLGNRSNICIEEKESFLLFCGCFDELLKKLMQATIAKKVCSFLQDSFTLLHGYIQKPAVYKPYIDRLLLLLTESPYTYGLTHLQIRYHCCAYLLNVWIVFIYYFIHVMIFKFSQSNKMSNQEAATQLRVIVGPLQV